MKACQSAVNRLNTLHVYVPASASSLLFAESHVHLTDLSRHTAVGTFQMRASDGAPPVTVKFHLHESPSEGARMSLSRPNGDNLLHFKWTRDASSDRLSLVEHQILKKRFSGASPQERADEETEGEAREFAQLRQSTEYRALPVLSQELGYRHNVTGWSMTAAFALHKFALDAENIHGTLAKLEKRKGAFGSFVVSQTHLVCLYMTARNGHTPCSIYSPRQCLSKCISSLVSAYHKGLRLKVLPETLDGCVYNLPSHG